MMNQTLQELGLLAIDQLAFVVKNLEQSMEQ